MYNTNMHLPYSYVLTKCFQCDRQPYQGTRGEDIMFTNLSIILYSNSHNLPIILTDFTYIIPKIILDLMLMALQTANIHYWLSVSYNNYFKYFCQHYHSQTFPSCSTSWWQLQHFCNKIWSNILVIVVSSYHRVYCHDCEGFYFRCHYTCTKQWFFVWSCYLWLDLRKLSLSAQEMKSNL